MLPPSPLTDPDAREHGIKCDQAHMMRNVALVFMWRSSSEVVINRVDRHPGRHISLGQRACRKFISAG